MYKDDFHDSLENYKRITGQVDGNGKAIGTNTETSGRYHTDWLNMMYPRLRLARNLLTDDGVVFISIDDNEVDNLKKICNEVFGEDNFVCKISREAIRGGSQSKNIRNVLDYMICFAKNINDIEFGGIEQEGISLNLKDEHGRYAKGRELNKWGAGSRREDSPSMYYPIIGPNGEDIYPIRNDGSEGRWRLGKKTMENLLASGNAIFELRENGTYIVYEKLRDDSPRIKQFTTLFSDCLNALGTEELKLLFENERAIFDFAKPSNLINNLMIMANINNNDIVLDFFSGSSTTAHAVMQLNAEDGGNRKFIMVQLPEPTDVKSEAYKAGYKNICEIGKERIRRAGEKILELSLENLEKEGVIEKIDLSSKDLILESEGMKRYAGKLSEVADLEEGNGFGSDSLSALREVAENRTLFTTRSNETGRNINTQQYSGGTSEGKEGVHSISKNSTWEQGGTGNTIIALRTAELLKQHGYRISPEFINGNKQNDSNLDKKSKLLALNSKLSNDIGFKVLKLDTSNIRKWQPDYDNLEQSLLDYIDNYVEGRTELDVVYEIMLKYGLDLTYPVDEFTIAGKKVYSIGFGMLMICLDDEITTEVAKGIITKVKELAPESTRVVFKDNGFKTDSNKTNIKEILKSGGIEEFITL